MSDDKYNVRAANVVFWTPNLVFGTSYVVFGTPNLVFGTSYVVFGTPKCSARDIICSVRDTKILFLEHTPNVVLVTPNVHSVTIYYKTVN